MPYHAGAMAPRKRISVLAPLAALLIACAIATPSQAQQPAADSSAAPADSAAANPAEEFPVALGSFTTTLLGSRPERSANIRLAAEALDGTILAPGEVLSFNVVVGPRSIGRGYQAAPVILHETRQLQTGGGVCQVASTMFAAGLLSGLSCVERWRHSSPVDYIAPGEDATIAWGAKDLRLRNDLGQRVRVRIAILGSTLSVRFQGEAPPAHEYELATDERELPADPGVEGAQPGREIELYRLRHDARGIDARELVHRDVYPPSRGRKEAP